MMRQVRMAAFAAVVSLVLSGLALARDHDRDDDNRRDKDHHGQQYHGRSDRDWDRDGDRWRNRNRDGDRDRDRNWQRDRGYNPYYGGNQPWYGRNGGNYRRYNNAGYNQGYSDGSLVARQDMSSGKPFNPNPRGVYGGADRGYHSADGDKGAYRQEYLSGYRSGYQSSFRGGSYGRWGF